VVDNELRTEQLPLEERIRRMGGERSYAIGTAIGEALLKLSRGVSSHLPHHGAKGRAPSLGERVAAGD
jgi:hypothetical protein